MFQLPENTGSVRTVTCNDQGMMLIGTKSNRILYGGFDKQFDTLVYVSSLWFLQTIFFKLRMSTPYYAFQLIKILALKIDFLSKQRLSYGGR